MNLYEAHLPVADVERSREFYEGVVGLTFAYRDPKRDIVFLYIGEDRGSMLGLWGPETEYGEFHRMHFAIAMTLAELTAEAERLKQLKIATHDFNGNETSEPSVIGWMPSAQLYFHDPDGHLVEFIALLDDPPDASFIGPLSLWKHRHPT